MNAERRTVMNGRRPEDSGHIPEQDVLAQLIGSAPAFANLVSKLPMVARADGTVLITGQTGAPALKALPDATWGLHLVDANIALGDLVTLVGKQAKQYAAH